MQKLNDRLEKDRKKGVNIEEIGPPEMALDEESDSEDSSSSESEGESEGESSSSSDLAGKSNGKSVEGETEDEEISDNDDDKSDSNSSMAAEEEDDAPVSSIEKAIADPIFTHPRAASTRGFKNKSCYICPVAILKTEVAIEKHLGGGVSHVDVLRSIKHLY